MIIVAGITMISSPLWETLILALFQKQFDLSSYIPNEPIYGTFLIISALVYNITALWIDNKNRKLADTTLKRRLKQDRLIFDDIRSFLPEEFMGELLNEHCWGQSIPYATLRKIHAIDIYLDRMDIMFLDPQCENYRVKFKEAFHRFVNNNDFIQISPVLNNSERYGIPKEWSHSSEERIRKNFETCMDNLNDLSSKAYTAYVEMFTEVRKLLATK